MAFTFDSNGKSVTISTAGGLNASGADTKTLTLGASVWTLSGNLNLSGSGLTLNANTSEFLIKFTSAINIGTQTLYKLSFGSDGFTATLNSDIRVSNTLDLATTGNTITFNGNNFLASGNVQKTGTGVNTNGTTTLQFTGTANQTFSLGISGRLLLPITINKTGGTLTLSGTLLLNCPTFTHTAGTVDAGTSAVTFGATVTIDITGGMSFYDLNFGSDGFTATLNTNITVSNILDIASTDNTITLNGNKILAQGTVQKTGTTTNNNGTTTIEFSGGNNQTWSWSSTGVLNNPIIINKSANTLTFSGTIILGGDFTYTAGTVSAGTSTVRRNGGVNHNSGTLAFNNWETVTSGTITLTGNLDVNGNLTIGSGTTLSAGSNTITPAGNWTNNGTFTRATSTVTFDG